MHINDIPQKFDLPSLIWDFMSHVSVEPTPKGCRLWIGAGEDYGGFTVDGQKFGAHRLSFVLFNGPIVDDLHVLHRCDTPACVHPGHLFLGTEADNHADKAAKGRAAKGVNNGSAKISEEVVLAIFSASGRHSDIASTFQVAKSTVCHIKSGRQWSSITGKVLTPSSRARSVLQAPSA